MDWLDLLAVLGTLKSLLQYHSSKASILWHSAFFTVQLSQPYKTTGKTIALTRRTLVGKVMSLLLNMLCRLVITFLPRSRHLLGVLVLKGLVGLHKTIQLQLLQRYWNAGTKLESRLPGEISITSDMQMTPPLWQKVKKN